MRTVDERLQELLDLRDARIERLEEELGDVRDKLECAEANLEHMSRHGWMLKRLLPAEQTLPVPRLELTVVRSSEEELNWYYRIVYRHFDGDVVSLPISQTRSRGHTREPIHDGLIDLPLRDGVHIHHDMAHLSLPAFIVCGDRVEQLDGSRLRAGHEVLERGRSHRTGG